jgi:hypothetical protein
MRTFPPGDQRAEWSIPPRACIDLQTPAEALIRAAISAVEELGAHPELTRVVIELGRALDTLGIYIDTIAP